MKRFYFIHPFIMSDNDSSGGMSAVVAIVAIIAILGVGYFIMQNVASNAETAPVIDVQLPAGDAE